MRKCVLGQSGFSVHQLDLGRPIHRGTGGDASQNMYLTSCGLIGVFVVADILRYIFDDAQHV